MNPVDRDLERQIHAALTALPEPRAPRSLAPRVMQAVATAAAAKAHAGWRAWPLHWQLAALVLGVSTAVAMAIGVRLASAWLAALPAAHAASAFWNAFIAPIAAPILLFTAVMCAACALLVAALKHVAWEGRETPQS